jgi:hypothetical protein
VRLQVEESLGPALREGGVEGVMVLRSRRSAGGGIGEEVSDVVLGDDLVFHEQVLLCT